jgi:hypothetical protein
MLLSKQNETNLSLICGIIAGFLIFMVASLPLAASSSPAYLTALQSCSSQHSRPISVAAFMRSFLRVIVNRRGFLQIVLDEHRLSIIITWHL